MLRSPSVSTWNRELGIAVRLQTQKRELEIAARLHYGTGNSIPPPLQYGDTGSQDRSRDRRPSHIKPGSRGRHLHREPGIRDHRPSPSRTGISRSSPVSMWNQAFEIAVRLHIDTGSQDRRPSASGTGHRPSPYHRPSIRNQEIEIAIRLHMEPGTSRPPSIGHMEPMGAPKIFDWMHSTPAIMHGPGMFYLILNCGCARNV